MVFSGFTWEIIMLFWQRGRLAQVGIIYAIPTSNWMSAFHLGQQVFSCCKDCQCLSISEVFLFSVRLHVVFKKSHRVLWFYTTWRKPCFHFYMPEVLWWAAKVALFFRRLFHVTSCHKGAPPLPRGKHTFSWLRKPWYLLSYRKTL